MLISHLGIMAWRYVIPGSHICASSRQPFMIVQECDLQAVSDAASLVAVREAAVHLLHYGSYVALNHVKSLFLDIPTVSQKMARVLQALQRDLDISCGSNGDADVLQPSCVAAVGGQPRRQVFSCAPLHDPQAMAATGVMWPILMEKLQMIKEETVEQGCGLAALVLVDAAATELAFHVIAGSGMSIKQFSTFCSEGKAAGQCQVWPRRASYRRNM